jgi:hypothetical protein
LNKNKNFSRAYYMVKVVVLATMVSGCTSFNAFFQWRYQGCEAAADIHVVKSREDCPKATCWDLDDRVLGYRL